MAKKMLASHYDTRQKLFVDCSECERGGKGDQTCSSGWTIKTKNRGGCFCGDLLEPLKSLLPPAGE